MAAVPRSGTPEKSAAPSRPVDARPVAAAAGMRRRLLASAAIAAAVALLFVAYLRVSLTFTENSDSANILLMSWDMLHGNLLLHGWYLSDVSFYPTELPQYAILERLIGLHADTAHVAAAITYTLVVLLAVLLARGRASGRGRAWPPMALTAGLMIAPSFGVGAFVLLLSVGHIGTAVPLMLTWLVIDRANPGERPSARSVLILVIVGLLLTWVLVADPLVLVVGIVPLATVCAMRVIRAVSTAGPGQRGAALQARWYEVSLAAAAILAYGLAALVNRLLRASGGFVVHSLGYQLAPVHTWPKHAWVTGEGLLALFGAKPQGPAAEMAFAVLHLAGVALVAWAVWRVARQFVTWPDLISQILVVAIVLNVVVYVPSTLASATDLNAREFAVVLPFGAVLAGRVLARELARELAEPLAASWRAAEAGPLSWLRGARWRAGLASALAVGYLASLGYAAAQPSVPPANAQLAVFLAEHHLTDGISGYWLSSIVTVGSDGAVTVRAVQPSLRPYLWEAKGSWYDPGSQRATFLVTDSQAGYFNHWQPSASALAALGPPVRTYRVGPYTVLVWNNNLLPGPG